VARAATSLDLRSSVGCALSLAVLWRNTARSIVVEVAFQGNRSTTGPITMPARPSASESLQASSSRPNVPSLPVPKKMADLDDPLTTRGNLEHYRWLKTG